jgi:hypothetical protein
MSEKPKETVPIQLGTRVETKKGLGKIVENDDWGENPLAIRYTIRLEDGSDTVLFDDEFVAMPEPD